MGTDDTDFLSVPTRETRLDPCPISAIPGNYLPDHVIASRQGRRSNLQASEEIASAATPPRNDSG